MVAKQKISEIALIWKLLICLMQNYANYAENIVKCCVKINICVTVLALLAYINTYVNEKNKLFQ